MTRAALSKGADLSPLRRVRLSEEIADRLIAGIVGGRFRFGEKLPSERELARYLDVGRPTLREAIRTLSAIGLVEVRHGEGIFVVDHHGDFVSKAFSWALLLGPRTVAEVIEVRLALESAIVELAAERATEDDLGRLASLLDDMERSLGNPKRFTAADVQFHLTLAEASRNTILAQLLFASRSLLERWITRSLAVSSTDALALEQHREIVRAIAGHDQVRARDAMRLHLQEMGRRVLDQLGPQPVSDDLTRHIASPSRRDGAALRHESPPRLDSPTARSTNR
jgi:GntR family transcriptional repressor for pyruvate dehydrogenase complex